MSVVDQEPVRTRRSPSADHFDVTRELADRHIAFGFGEHLCLGAALARMEARILFEELLTRWPEWDLVGDPTPLESCLINGLAHLPVTLKPPLASTVASSNR